MSECCSIIDLSDDALPDQSPVSSNTPTDFVNFLLRTLGPSGSCWAGGALMFRHQERPVLILAFEQFAKLLGLEPSAQHSRDFVLLDQERDIVRISRSGTWCRCKRVDASAPFHYTLISPATLFQYCYAAVRAGEYIFFPTSPVDLYAAAAYDGYVHWANLVFADEQLCTNKLYALLRDGYHPACLRSLGLRCNPCVPLDMIIKHILVETSPGTVITRSLCIYVMRTPLAAINHLLYSRDTTLSLFLAHKQPLVVSLHRILPASVLFLPGPFASTSEVYEDHHIKTFTLKLRCTYSPASTPYDSVQQQRERGVGPNFGAGPTLPSFYELIDCDNLCSVQPVCQLTNYWMAEYPQSNNGYLTVAERGNRYPVTINPTITTYQWVDTQNSEFDKHLHRHAVYSLGADYFGMA